MRISKAASTFIAFALATASSTSFAAQRYTISASLSDRGKIFGSPSIVVREGVEAAVSVSGPNGYKMVVKLTDAGNDKLKIIVYLDSVHGSLSPVVVVYAGRPATVSVGDMTIGLTAVRIDG